MLVKFYTYVPRLMAAILVAALIAAFLPQAGFAASVPTLTIKEVKVGESVTVHASNFPTNVAFTVRMDRLGNYALGGTIVGYVNSGSGSFDATYPIPDSLQDEKYIAIRMDGVGGWYSYNWFTNKTSAVVTPTPTSTKPYIEVIAVDANERITVQAHRFPAGQTFRIRIGSFKNFFKDYVVVGTIYSGQGGSFKFNVDLPETVKGVDLVTVRLDSPEKQYAYNAFKNVDSGTVPVNGGTQTPAYGTCQIQSTYPKRIMSKGEDFDAVWTVKNTSSRDWLASSVDYKFVSGSQLHKYLDRYDFKETIKAGETVKIVVDMIAPAQAGTYAVNWSIVEGNTTLCTMPLTIVVR